jgi:CBS domain-containing protein
MKPVAHILKSKTDQSVYTITPTARVFDALKLMAEKEDFTEQSPSGARMAVAAD